VANDAADYRATHHADRAAAGQDGAAPTAPTPAPIMVHPTRPNSTVTTTAFTTKFLYLVHLEYFRVKHQAPRNYLPGGLLVVVLLCFVHTKFLGAA
jgi:hypothetical protein